MTCSFTQEQHEKKNLIEIMMEDRQRHIEAIQLREEQQRQHEIAFQDVKVKLETAVMKEEKERLQMKAEEMRKMEEQQRQSLAAELENDFY
jgi:hypothetical protein